METAVGQADRAADRAADGAASSLLLCVGFELPAHSCAPSPPRACLCAPPTPPRRLALHASDVDSILGRMPSLRRLVVARQPAGFGFGPYARCWPALGWQGWPGVTTAVLPHDLRTPPPLPTAPSCLPCPAAPAAPPGMPSRWGC